MSYIVQLYLDIIYSQLASIFLSCILPCINIISIMITGESISSTGIIIHFAQNYSKLVALNQRKIQSVALALALVLEVL